MKRNLLFVMMLCLASFGVASAQQTQNLLTEDFSSMSSIATTYSATDWYAYNAGNGNNWVLYSGTARYNYSSSYAANCYLVSAPFSVSADMIELSVSLAEKTGSYSETFEVFFVKASDVTSDAAIVSATQYSAIASASYNNTTAATVSGSVSAAALAGQSVRVVVHCTSAADMYYLTVDDITVNETIAPQGPYIMLTPTEETVFTGFNTTLTATYGNVTNPTITYSSSNTSVATVTGSGTTATVTGVAPGTATITATMNGSYTATCAITVENPSYCTPGTGNYDNDGIYNVTFGTNGMVVNNTVSGINYGDYSNLVGAVETETNGFEVAITYKTGYTYGTIIWVDWDDSYSFEGTEVVYAGTSTNSNPTTLTATFDVPATAPVGNHRMRIIGADMALDSYTGSLSAAANADPCGSYNYSTCHDYTLNVFAASTDPSITLTPATATVLLDETATLTAIVRNVTNPTITWTSSNTSVATVSGNGTTATVTGVAVGTATITASMTVDGTTYTSTSTITVATDPCAKTIPYTYGFEDESEFSCWSAVDCETDTYQGLSGILDYYPNTGSYAFSFSSYCGNTDPQYLISPALSGVQDGVHVEFDYAIVDFSQGAPETFKVGYSTTNNNVSSFTWSEEITCTSSSYEHYSANFMGQVKYIAVQYTSADSYYLFLDDFLIEEAPNCLEPTNIVASNETTTSATISWTAGGSETEWDIYFTTNSSDVPTASTTPSFSGLTTNSFNTIDNNYTLTPATTYYVYVRSACSSTETSAWSTPGIFNTECNTMSLPYSETFEAGDLTVCWTPIIESPVYMSVSVDNANPYEGTYHLNLDRRTPNGTQIVVLPEVDAAYALNNAEVSFYAMLSSGGSSNYTSSGRTLTIGVMTDPNDESTFVAVGSAVEPTSSYALYTFDLSSYTGNGQYIAIKHDEVTSGNNGYTYIDNLEVNFNGYTKHIIGYNSTEGNGYNYYLIASPLAADVDPEDVTNMLSNTYDLYYFDQAEQDGLEWVNYKSGENQINANFGDLTAGKGYLYANSQSVDLVFTGSANTNGSVTLDKVGSGNWDGWNLVGNPFTEDAYIGNRAYYRMNSNGTEIEAATAGTAIAAMEGVFVIAASDGETLTFSTTAPTKKESNLAINVSKDNSLIDRAILGFGHGSALPKFQLNPNHTKIYMPVEGNDYAVVYTENEGEMPVSFKAEKNGTYTLSFTTEDVELGYLHLIDNMTGNDVDLLSTPSYTFEASTTDYAQRFRLVFAAGNNDDNFAFFSNGSFVITNEGMATLQVVDVMGRIISSETINGNANVNVNAAPGVYMLRLVNGDNVKVQKVVVR